MTFRSIRSIFAFFLLAGLMCAADPGLMNLLMPNAKAVAGVNVGQAKMTPFGQFLLARMSAENHLTAKTGFDPRTDLQEVLIGIAGPSPEQSLVLARGTFNTQVIFAAAEAAGATVESYNGVPILTGQENSATHAFAFLGTSIAIAGDLGTVQAAVDRRTATATAIDPALAAQIGQLSDSLDAWSISTVPLSALANQKLPDQQLNAFLSSDLLKSIVQTSGGVKFGQTVQFSGQAVADTSQNATALADVVRFLGNMAQTNAPAAAAAAIASLMQSLSVQTDGNTINVAAALPESQLENLVRSAHAH
jgi:hypothetical protein